MEYTSTQLSVINTILPPKYKIEVASRLESKPRRSEAESLDSSMRFQPSLPEKRQQRDFQAPSISSSSQSPNTEKLLKILYELKKHPKISHFLSPVDIKSVPDYYERIKEPMDLGTVENKLRSGAYENARQMAADVRLIWNNSFFYNSDNMDLYPATMELSMLFEKVFKGSEGITLSLHKTLANEDVLKLESTAKSTKPEVPASKAMPKANIDRPLSYSEKKLLCQNIQKLEPRYLKGLLDIVRECTDIKGEELEFDVERLPPRVCRELDKYVKSCMQSAKCSKAKPSSTVESIKSSQVATNAKLSQVASEIERLEKVKSEPVQPEESESESSSTSESEDEEIPQVDPQIGNLNFPNDDDLDVFSATYSHIVDFNDVY